MPSKDQGRNFSAFPRKERIAELDVLRGLALLGVVLQHALGVYVRKPDIQVADAAMIGMLFNFTKFAVPTFVFVTGAVLLYNYYDRLDYPKFIRKRTMEIFLPYLLWTGIYEIYYNGLPAFGLDWLKEFVKNIILGNASYHLWFVVMIFQFYLIYPVLLACFKWFHKRISSNLRFVIAVTMLTALYTLLMWFSSSYIPGSHFQAGHGIVQEYFVEYRDRNFLFFSYYFVLGGIAGVALLKWREFAVRSVTWNGFLFAASFLWIGYELMKGASGGQINLNYSTSLKPSMFFYTVSEILLFYGLSMAIVKHNAILFRPLALLGNLSYGAYLAHALVLGYVVRGISRVMPSGHYLLAGVLAFLLCSAISTGVTIFISRVPYGKILIGPHGRS